MTESEVEKQNELLSSNA